MNYTKWAVRRTPNNYREINNYFGTLNNRSYSATGRWMDNDSNWHFYDFLIFPKLKSTTRVAEIPASYDEISWEEFQIYILKKQLSYELY